MNEPWIYINYLAEDLSHAETISGRLKEEGFAVWLDVERLVPGQQWEPELEKAVERAAGVIAVCSKARERFPGGNIADRQLKSIMEDIGESGRSLPIIPVLVEPAQIPDFLGHLQAAWLFESSGWEGLLRALRAAVSAAGPADAVPHAPKTLLAPQPPDDLIDACLAGDCVLYAGAGLSAAAGFPTWVPFIGQLLDWAASSGVAAPEDSKKLKAALAGGEVDLVADTIVRAVQKAGREEDLHAFLVSVFVREKQALPQRYTRLARLGLSAALTTTFDPLLERTFAQHTGPVLTPGDSEALLGALSRKDFFVGKLYGRLADPASVILAPSQYEEAIARNEAFGQFMESLFVSRTLLFLGCSLNGIRAYLGGLRIKGANRRHYALVAVEDEVWETKAAHLRDRYGIQVIPLPKDGEQESVDVFIDNLAKAIARRREQVLQPGPSRPNGAAGDTRPGLLREIRLQNIGLFADLRLELDPHWNVLLGDNGVGKSTVLKAVALAFCGRDGRDYAERLLAAGQTSGQITVRTDRQEYVTNLSRTRSGVEVTSLPDRPLELEGWLTLGFPALRTLTWRAARVGSDDDGRGRPLPQDLIPLLTGDPDPRLDDVKDWIVSLDYWMHRGGIDPDRIQDFREGLFELLADVTRTPGLRFDRVETQSNRVMVAADGLSLPIEAMSQGTASLLGWMGVLVRRLFQVYGGDGPKALDRPALVLIDELDAHMHPGWQQVVASRLGERFPKVQFIATTHSPLVVAGLEASQVARFRRLPGKGVVAEPPPHELKGVGVAGLLTSELFSLSSQLDPETESLLARKRALAARDELSPEETSELAELDERLGRVDFSTAVRDPLYSRFVRAMTELRQAETRTEEAAAPSRETPEQLERQRDLARQVLGELLAEEREVPGREEGA